MKRTKREGALERLQSQIKTGMKNTKEGPVELTDKDVKRINKEIEILKIKLQ